MGEEERAKKESKMKGDQRMPVLGGGGPGEEETRSSNLERQCYGRKDQKKWKNTEERIKRREHNELRCN